MIWPGVYHENDPQHNAGIWITTPDLHIRGLNRSAVIIDGSHGTARQPCPSDARQQNFTARDGIVVWKTDGVTIDNLTVCNYLSTPDGTHGNQIWWDGGDGSGKIGLNGFEGSYLTATSMYHPAGLGDRRLAQYGIYMGNAAGPGQVTNSYASNMASGAFYVGACRRVCNAVLARDQGTNSAIGYLGTNAGGRLIIKDSIFTGNRTGMAPTSLNNDDAPPPQDGRCPASVAQSCTLIEDNQVSQNNNANAPVVNGLTPPIGVGIMIDGGQFDTITGNMITDNGSWGVLATDSVDVVGHLPYSKCQGGYRNLPSAGLCLLPARGNVITGNTFADDGSFGNAENSDLATVALIAGSAIPRNCFYGNRADSGTLTSVPTDIEQADADGIPCGAPGTGGDHALVAQLNCATLTGQCTIPRSNYPRRTGIDYVPLPALPEMPHACTGVPPNTFCATASQLSSSASLGPASMPDVRGSLYRIYRFTPGVLNQIG